MGHDPKQITETAFRLTPAFQELLREQTLDPESIKRVSERLERLRVGLAPELEFVSVVNWLGKCRVLHRLDQLPLPRYRTGQSLKVPDVLAVSEVNGKLIPVLIEIKKSEDKTLVWSDKYLRELLAYADAVRMPLLVAWKKMNIWTLAEVQHFEKRVSAYHLSWEKSLKENLMASLFGDLMIVLNERIAFFMDNDITSAEPLPPLPALLPPGQYRFTITAAGFLLDDKRVNIQDELKWFVMLQANENTVVRTSESTVRSIYRPDPQSLSSLADYGLTMLLWKEQEGQNADWETIARKRIALSAESMTNALRDAMKEGVVKYVFRQAPQTMPQFLL